VNTSTDAKTDTKAENAGDGNATKVTLFVDSANTLA
jgi:hypothetical protein